NAQSTALEDLTQVRVYGLPLTRRGWLVVSPLRYSGDLEGRERRLRRSQLVGYWQLIDHGHAISAEINDSVALRLESDGTHGGGAEGRWRLEGGARAVRESGGVRRGGG